MTELDGVISVLPADGEACGNYRLFWPALHLAEQGHPVIANPFRGIRSHDIELISEPDPTFPDPRGRVVDVSLPEDVRAVVVQRIASPRLHQAVTILKEKGVKVIVDVDDALWALHPLNVAKGAYDGSRGTHYKWLLKACRIADLVTSTTTTIQKKVGGLVLPNVIPDAMTGIGRARLEGERSDGPVQVGWGATIITHPGDPASTRGKVAQAIRESESGARFVALGGQPDREPLAFGFDRWEVEAGVAVATGPIDKRMWINALAGLDVSVVPLEDTEFNRSKSSLKMLESAAAGCAVVASPTPDNVRTVEGGVGMIASTPHDWYRIVKELAGEPGLAREQGEKNLAAVSEMTIEKNSWRWLEAWMSVMT